MEHIAALLLLIGCSDDLVECREIPAPVAVFETVEECEDVLPDSFGAHLHRYPQVFAQCIDVDPHLEEVDAELVWDIKPDGTLVAAVVEPDVMVAGSETGRADRLAPRSF